MGHVIQSTDHANVNRVGLESTVKNHVQLEIMVLTAKKPVLASTKQHATLFQDIAFVLQDGQD